MIPRGSFFTLSSLKTLLVTVCALAGLSASSLRAAETVYFSATTSSSAMRTGYSEPSAFTGYSSSHSTASGAIGTYCRYKTDQVASTPSFTISWAGDAGGSVKPTIPYGVYILNYSHGAVTLISSATYSIAANSGSCGYSTSGRSTTAFSTSAANTWVPLGLITMTGPTVTTPNFTTTISFTVGTGSLRVAADNFQLV